LKEDFTSIEDREPKKGEYCIIKVVSHFRGWYLPECKSWSWLMDEHIDPISHVEGWKKIDDKGDLECL
jgi:hypothetical protein